MKTEFDALKNVAGAFAHYLDQMPDNYLLGADSVLLAKFLNSVSIHELKLVIELAERYAGLCDE